jgi:ABC-type uncharacterized transport system permease subunit
MSMLHIGISCVIIGIADVVVGLCAYDYADAINEIATIGETFWQELLEPMKTAGLVTGLITLITGVVFIMITIVVACIRRAGRNNTYLQ